MNGWVKKRRKRSTHNFLIISNCLPSGPMFFDRRKAVIELHPISLLIILTESCLLLSIIFWKSNEPIPLRQYSLSAVIWLTSRDEGQSLRRQEVFSDEKTPIQIKSSTNNIKLNIYKQFNILQHNRHTFIISMTKLGQSENPVLAHTLQFWIKW